MLSFSMIHPNETKIYFFFASISEPFLQRSATTAVCSSEAAWWSGAFSKSSNDQQHHFSRRMWILKEEKCNAVDVYFSSSMVDARVQARWPFRVCFWSFC
jgi:hypothetical protein